MSLISAMRALVVRKKDAPLLSPISGGAWSKIVDWWPGAWQQNMENSVQVDETLVPAYWAVFSCVTLIAGDIAKLHPYVMRRQPSGAFERTAHRPVLNRPNHYQSTVEFFFSWLSSVLLQGNAFILKERNADGFVVAMYVLDPRRVTVLVSPDGSIFYRLNRDNLSGMQDEVTVPQSEIIHDRMYPLFHPLIGLSPIYACGVSAMQGSAIQGNSAKFFSNMSRPSGILTAPGAIKDETALRLKEQWQANYAGSNYGKVAVLGDGLAYQSMSVSPEASQMIEQLKMTAEMIAACFKVPPYKIGAGPMPTVNNTAQLNQQYYDQCLQYTIERIEARLDIGLELFDPFECWFDLSGLLRMDPVARYEAHGKAIAAGWLAPNEARVEEDRAPVEGGETPYMQQQNWPIAMLAKRELPTNAAAPTGPTPPAAEAPPKEAGIAAEDLALHTRALLRESLKLGRAA